MANNYDVNYDDQRFAQVETDKNAALNELENTYSGMINESDKFYQAQIDASKQWADTQSQLQQEQTDFAIEQIEQQKAQAQKDYTKEQSGAYVDWRKQSNEYGSEAEKMASQGLSSTGYSESSQVSMYNTYQNRVATARESFIRANLNYDNGIKEAKLQNNAALAEIRLNAYKEQLELSLQGFQYKNNLILEQANKKVELDNMYYSRYQDVLSQINHENAMAEQIRQFNQNYDMELKKYTESIRQFNAEIERLKAKDAQEHAMEIQKLELQKQQIAEEKRQFEESQKLKYAQLAEEQRQFNEQMAYTKSKSSGGSGAKGSVTKSKNKDATLQSILDLGKGPQSAQSIYNQVQSGSLVETKNSSGQTVFVPTSSTAPVSSSYWEVARNLGNKAKSGKGTSR